MKIIHNTPEGEISKNGFNWYRHDTPTHKYSRIILKWNRLSFYVRKRILPEPPRFFFKWYYKTKAMDKHLKELGLK